MITGGFTGALVLAAGLNATCCLAGGFIFAGAAVFLGAGGFVWGLAGGLAGSFTGCFAGGSRGGGGGGGGGGSGGASSSSTIGSLKARLCELSPSWNVLVSSTYACLLASNSNFFSPKSGGSYTNNVSKESPGSEATPSQYGCVIFHCTVFASSVLLFSVLSVPLARAVPTADGSSGFANLTSRCFLPSFSLSLFLPRFAPFRSFLPPAPLPPFSPSDFDAGSALPLRRRAFVGRSARSRPRFFCADSSPRFRLRRLRAAARSVTSTSLSLSAGAE